MGMEVRNEIANWQQHYDIACKEFGNAAGLHKNPLAIARTLEIAWEQGEQSESLRQLLKNILSFASNGAVAQTNVIEIDAVHEGQNTA
jgi:hypothetical protein